MNQKVDDKGILDPIGGWEGYFGANRWMKGNFVPFPILWGYRPFSIYYEYEQMYTNLLWIRTNVYQFIMNTNVYNANVKLET